eukprot:TRINITY_DN48305_c0_g1_i1.p1 TRINITY_DN48305_c0_g1~~TRINITY_DN48305_c0_g1_i1.p1  ORF type:complete len:705 (+),score=137.32 TRINITY_DN48305_c0_g1_i1:245-2116(+)
MMDVVTVIGGACEDVLYLRDGCPLPRVAGGAISLAVETAVEVIALARDTLDRMCLEAYRSEESLGDLAGKMPLQVVLLVARVRFTQKVDDALEASREAMSALAAVASAVSKFSAEVVGALQSPDVPGSRRAALNALHTILLEQHSTASSLAAADDVETAKKLWREEIQLRFNEDEDAFECSCSERTFPVASEYCPRLPQVTTEFTRRYRKAFFEAFDLRAPRWQGAKVLLVAGVPGSNCVKVGLDLCATLHVTPVVLRGSQLVDTDTFWSRVTSAARSSSGGGLGVVMIGDASQASKDTICAAVAACKQSQVALCLVVDPTTNAKCSIERCLYDNHVRVELEAPPPKLVASAMLGAEGFENANELAVRLLDLFESLESICSKHAHYDFGVPMLRRVCEEAALERVSHGFCPEKESAILAAAVASSLFATLAPADAAAARPVVSKAFDAELSPAMTVADADRWAIVARRSARTQRRGCLVLPVLLAQGAPLLAALASEAQKAGAELAEMQGALADFSATQLVGEIVEDTWTDGVFTKLLRSACVAEKATWLVVALGKPTSTFPWEIIDKVLDDGRMLQLPSGERIRLPASELHLRIIFFAAEAEAIPKNTMSRLSVVFSDVRSP